MSSNYTPKPIQYPKVPFAEPPRRVEVREFQAPGTYSHGTQINMSVNAPGAFLDPSSSYFMFDITPTITGTVGNLRAFLDGGSHCVIKQYRCWFDAGNGEIDNIPEYHKLYNFLMDNVDMGHAGSTMAMAFGGPAYELPGATNHVKYLQCLDMTPGAAGVYTVSHMPLGLMQSQQFIPMFATGPLNFQFTLEEGKRAFVLSAGGRARGADWANETITYTITNFRLVAKLIYYSEEDIKRYMQVATASGLELKLTSWMHSSDSAAASGTKNINAAIHAKSLKSLFVLPRDREMATGAAAATNPYLSVRPWQGITNVQLIVNDKSYPNTPMTITAKNYSQAYMEMKKALAQLGDVTIGDRFRPSLYLPQAGGVANEALNTYVADQSTGVDSFFALGFDLETSTTVTVMSTSAVSLLRGLRLIHRAAASRLKVLRS